MFLTHIDSQSRLQPFLATGTIGWDFVELGTQTPVVWVEAVEENDGSEKLRTMLVKAYELASLVARDDFRISCLRLLSPGYLNRSGGWAFDLIREVWRCMSLHEEMPVLGWAFVLQDGRVYVYCGNATNAAEVKRTTCIFGPLLSSPLSNSSPQEGPQIPDSTLKVANVAPY